MDAGMFGGHRIYSTLDNPNVLGQYLIFVVMFALALAYTYRKLLYKFAAFGVLAVAALCLLYTQSRGAWLGLIFAFAVFAFLRDRKLVAIGLVALFLSPLFLPETVIDRFLSIGNTADSSTLYRVHIWNACLNMIRDYWVSGIGIGEGTFARIYPIYAFNAISTPHSHNLFLQIIIDIGISGIVIFLLVMTCFYKNVFMAVKRSPSTSALSAALCAAMTGYLIQGMTDNVFYNYRVVAFFWFCVAVGAAFSNKKEDNFNNTLKGY
jgi:O-antigen ligase